MSLSIREVKLLNKTTLRFLLHPRMAITRKQMRTHAGEGVGKGDPLFSVARDENWCSHFGNQC